MTARLFMIFVLWVPLGALADENRTFHVESPAHRVALLELYTSEGCSSCPPADRFLSALKNSGVDGGKVVPLAFHITYWDYIGWEDRFAHKAYDQRQRNQALLSASRRVYTPQFLLNGSDYRRYRTFANDISEVNSQQAMAVIELDASLDNKRLLQTGVMVDVQTPPQDAGGHVVWLAVFEHELGSDVTDGENAGASLHHDYVVRKLYGPYPVDGSSARVMERIDLQKEWKTNDLGLAAFVQKANDSEVVQAVSLMLE